MDKEKKKKGIAKEAAKALGVTGASAAIGAAYLDPERTVWRLTDVAYPDSPFDNLVSNIAYREGGLFDKIDENPNLGVGINAAASGIGGLAAYGLLKGSVKGLKKLDDKRFQRKVALHNATNNIKVNNS